MRTNARLTNIIAAQESVIRAGRSVGQRRKRITVAISTGWITCCRVTIIARAGTIHRAAARTNAGLAGLAGVAGRAVVTTSTVRYVCRLACPGNAGVRRAGVQVVTIRISHALDGRDCQTYIISQQTIILLGLRYNKRDVAIDIHIV
jgi:hypothetical protein